MENLETIFPIFNIAGNGIISVIIQVLVFIVVVIIMIQIIRLYFKNIELKNNPNKNQTEIEENLEKIEKIKKKSIKIGGIAFSIIIVTLIILSNFIEF